MPLPHTGLPTPTATMYDLYGLHLADQPSSARSKSTSSRKTAAPTPTQRLNPYQNQSQSQSRASLDSQRTLAAALAPAQAPRQKDYAAAFAALSSTYGFGGGAPVVPAFPAIKSSKTRR